MVIVAYGVASRSAMTAREIARKKGLAVGLLRPITLFPFPYEALANLADKGASFLVAELSSGQLIEDIRLAVGRNSRVELVSRCGGLPLPAESILEAVEKMTGQALS